MVMQCLAFMGQDTFVLKAEHLLQSTDYASTEKIDCGTGETLWSSGSAPTDWEIDANGMANIYCSMNGITDLADKFFLLILVQQQAQLEQL